MQGVHASSVWHEHCLIRDGGVSTPPLAATRDGAGAGQGQTRPRTGHLVFAGSAMGNPHCPVQASKKMDGDCFSPKGGAMRKGFRIVCFLAVIGAFGVYGRAQSAPATAPGPSLKTVPHGKNYSGPVKEMGKGGADIGKGVVKGTGDLAMGTGNAVGNLARGNIGSAGVSMSKGAVGLGKNLTVGTSKGLGKIAKGVGGELRKL